MTPTTGCLILAVVVGVLLAVAWRERARHQRTVNNWMDNAAFLRDEREEARAAASDRLDCLLKEERKVRDLQSQLDTTTHHNRDLQATIAELESERRAYDLTVANCDHLRVENERLANQLEAVGIKSAEVMVAEHDRIGVTQPIAFEEIQLSHTQAAQLERIREKQHWQPVAAIGSVSVLNSAGEQVTQKIEKLRHNPPRVRDDETND